MNDLIDRRTLIKDLIADCLKAKEETKYPSIKELYKRIEELIDKQKQIEAKPVVHGEWIKGDTGEWQCSVCREENCYAYCEPLKRFTDLYCPNCGADMRGGKNG